MIISKKQRHHLYAAVTVILLLTLCNITGYASSTDTTYDESLSALNAMGVLNLPDSEGDNQNITRAQFAANIFNIAGYEKVNHSAADIPFSDVSVDYVYKDEICTLYDLKIINGTENGFFSPEEPITYVQAVKLAADILGYREYVSVKYGKYPNGYISAAYDLKLTDGIKSPVTDIPLNLKDAVRFLYNTACSFVSEGEEYKTNGGITYAKDSRMLITKGHNIYYGEGVLKSNGVCALTGVTLKKGHTEINNEEYMIGKCDVLSLLGSKVKYFYREEKGGNVLLWTSEHKSNKTLTINSRDLITDDTDYSAEKIIYYDKNKRTAAEISPFASIVYNNKLRNSSQIKPKTGNIKLVDNNNDGSYDTVVVTEFKNMFVVSVSQKGNFISDSYNHSLNLDDYNNIYIYENGVQIYLDDIGSKRIISYVTDAEKENLYIYVCKKGVEATLDAIGEKSGKTVYEFNGKELYMSEEYLSIGENNYNTVLPKVGVRYLYYTDIAGDIAEITEVSGNILEYAYLINAAKDSRPLAKDNSAALRLLMTDGNIITAYTAKDIIIDGVGKKNGSDILSDNRLNTAAGFNEQVIKVRFTSSGELKEICFPENCKSEYGYDVKNFTTDFDGTATFTTNRQIYTFNYKYSIYPNTIIFARYDNINVDEPYAVIDYNALKGIKRARLYDCDKTLSPSVVAVELNGEAYSENMILVDNIKYEQQQDGNFYKKIYGYSYGKPYDCVEYYEGVIPNDLKRGDVVRAALLERRVVKIEKIVSLSEPPAPRLDNLASSNFSIIVGELYAISEHGIVTLNPINTASRLTTSAYSSQTSGQLQIYDTVNDIIRPALFTEIMPITLPYSDGTLCQNNGSLWVVLYRKYEHLRDAIAVYY